MAIPKEPAELEARLLKAGETLRQVAKVLREALATNRMHSTVDLVVRVAESTADEVLS